MSPTRRDILKASAGAVAATLVGVNVQAVSEPEPLRIESMPHIVVQAKLSDGRLVMVMCDRHGDHMTIGRHGDWRDFNDPRIGELIRKQSEVSMWLSLNLMGIEVESDTVPPIGTLDDGMVK